LSHASSLEARPAALDWLSQSDKGTERKAPYLGLYRPLHFFIQLVFKNQKIGNSKYGSLVPKWAKNPQIVDAQ